MYKYKYISCNSIKPYRTVCDIHKICFKIKQKDES